MEAEVLSVIRLLDFIISLVGILTLFPLFILLLLIGFLDNGSPIFIQARVGKHKRSFQLVKFRTMKLGTLITPTHLADKNDITKFGVLLRNSKLDELPQLWNVLKGEMSIVGPRPCLFEQVEVIEEREGRGVYNFRPGITGLAQIANVDMSNPQALAQLDEQLVSTLSISKYFYLIFKTITGSGSGDAIT